MGKHNQAATVAQVQPSNARMLVRIAAVQALRTEHKAARTAKATALATQQQGLQQIAALQLQVAQLQQQYGVATKQGSARANSATVVPSVALVQVAGAAMQPCAAARAIAVQHYPNRKAALKAMLLAGINVATASTQYGIVRKQQGCVVTTVAAEAAEAAATATLQ
jgi:hypothetical protein